MLHLDITGTLGKSITPSFGIPDQEFTAIRSGVKRHVESWLKERGNGEHAWSMDPYHKESVRAVKSAVKELKERKIQTVIWVGIGGSSLGPKVIQEVFETPETMEFVLLDTIDPAILRLVLTVTDWKKTLVIVACKSGETLETMSVFMLLWNTLCDSLGSKAASHVLGITDPQKGHLRDFCIEQRIAMLPIPPNVGGRFSIFSPVGLLPLGLLGGDIDRFLRGAKEMDELCHSPDLDENPAALLASTQFLLEMKRGYFVRVIMPYSQRLATIARWNQQLIAESLGKTEVHNPIPVAAIGTQDQHSLLQQWMAGPHKCWHLFICEEEKADVSLPHSLPIAAFDSLAGKSFGSLLDACHEGTRSALTSAKRPHATLTLTRLDAYHLGQLFFLFLTEVIFLGKLYRIDPYGQPAVEVGKKLTKEILSRK